MKKIKLALRIIALTLVMLITGCASEDEFVKKPDVKPVVKPVQVAKPEIKAQIKHHPTNLALPTPKREPVKETREVLHFYTFKSEPAGAGIYVVDTTTGKEVGTLGTTPVRILLLKKNIEIIDGMYVTCTGLSPNAAGLTVAGRSGKVEQVEFQFKFKLQGYSDEMKIERILLNTSDTTEQTVSVPLVKVK